MASSDELKVSIDGPTLALLMFEALNHGSNAEGIILGKEVVHTENQQTDTAEVSMNRTVKLFISSCVFTAAGSSELYDERGEVNVSTLHLLKGQRDPQNKLTVMGWFQFFSDVPVIQGNPISLTAKFVHRDLCKHFDSKHLLYMLLLHQPPSAASKMTEQTYQVFVSTPGAHILKPVILDINNLGSTNHGTYTSEEVSPIDELHGGASGTPYVPNPHVAEVNRLAQQLENKIATTAQAISDMAQKQAKTGLRHTGLVEGTLCKKDPLEYARTRRQQEIEKQAALLGSPTDQKEARCGFPDFELMDTTGTGRTDEGTSQSHSPEPLITISEPETSTMETDEEVARKLQAQFDNEEPILPTTTRLTRSGVTNLMDSEEYSPQMDDYPPLSAEKTFPGYGRSVGRVKKDNDPEYNPKSTKPDQSVQNESAALGTRTYNTRSRESPWHGKGHDGLTKHEPPGLSDNSRSERSWFGSKQGSGEPTLASASRVLQPTTQVVSAAGSSRSSKARGPKLRSKDVQESLFTDDESDGEKETFQSDVLTQEQTRLAEVSSRKFDESMNKVFENVEGYSFLVEDADGTMYQTPDLLSDKTAPSTSERQSLARETGPGVKRRNISGGSGSMTEGSRPTGSAPAGSAVSNPNGPAANGDCASAKPLITDSALGTSSKPPFKKNKPEAGLKENTSTSASHHPQGAGRGRLRNGKQ